MNSFKELFFKSDFMWQFGVWEMHDDIFARRWDFPLPLLLLLYLLGKKVGKKAAGDKPISYYFHLKLFILWHDKNFFQRNVQTLMKLQQISDYLCDEIQAFQLLKNTAE